MTELAVFTGDIVKSGDLPAGGLDAVFASMAKAATGISDWQGMPARFTRFRGDGWQMTVAPKYVLRAAAIMRAAVRQTGKTRDTRLAIGLGTAKIPDNDLSNASGPAFEASGHALDAISRGALMVAPDGPVILRAALPLADYIVQGWTARQAEIVAALLHPSRPSQEDVAAKFGIRQQTVQEQADSGGATALAETCDVLETAGDAG